MSGGSPYDYGRDYSAPPGPGQSRYRMWMLWAVVGVIAVAAVAQALLGPDRSADPAIAGPELVAPTPVVGENGGADDYWTDLTPGESVPPGQAFRIRDWEITVLDAVAHKVELDWGEGPFLGDEVTAKVALTYVGETVGDLHMIEWGFGNITSTGTHNGYNPWDDWCTEVATEFTDVADVYETPQAFRGEVVVGRVCVPVAQQDVVGLELFPEVYNADDQVETATFALPLDGPGLPPPVGLTRVEAIEQAWAQASTSGRLLDAEIAVTGITPGAPSGEHAAADLVPLEVVVTTVNTDQSGSPPPPFELFAYGLSGAEYLIDYCDSQAWREVADSEPGAQVVHTFCVDVATADQGRLLLVSGGGWLNDRALVLRAEAEPEAATAPEQ